MPDPSLDIIIPVYNEGTGIIPVLQSLATHVKTPHRILICYDRDNDTTLAALPQNQPNILLVKNTGKGALGAIVTGFSVSTAPAVLMMPADDDFNAPRLDAMAQLILSGADIVCPSRFIGDGTMEGCPPLKAFLVRATAFFMFHILGVPTHDPTNGFRFFSRRVLDTIPIETQSGFAYSIELLVKCHRLGWPIHERPALWRERTTGSSRFRIFKWAPTYLRWVAYAMATRFLFRKPQTVVLKEKTAPSKS
jgi:dolichol-phosphate mannosyltransferase